MDEFSERFGLMNFLREDWFKVLFEKIGGLVL